MAGTWCSSHPAIGRPQRYFSRRFTHSGHNAGFDARIVGYKNGRQGAVVMINRNNNGLFIDEVLESIAREDRWPDYIPAAEQAEYVSVPSSVQTSYAGTYEASGQSAVVVIVEDEKLFARAGGDEWMRLYPSSQSEFFVLANATRWMFVRSNDGAAAEVVYATVPAKSAEGEFPDPES